MTTSVVIPTYNSAETIRETIESVLNQTIPPCEILIMDDGSRDGTAEIASEWEPIVRVFRQENRGAASARNALCRLAKGDVIAFLDSDDCWHADYLKLQIRNIMAYPNASMFFTSHVDVAGTSIPGEVEHDLKGDTPCVLIDPLSFFRRYTNAPGMFHMSCCCVTKVALERLGEEPFRGAPAEDTYFKYLSALYGPVVYSHSPLGVIRIRGNSVSANYLKSFKGLVDVFEFLNGRFRLVRDKELLSCFKRAAASSRRVYARHLMGDDNRAEARQNLWRSLSDSHHPTSLAKSTALLLSTYAPAGLQPTWPPSHRPPITAAAGQELN